MLNDTSRVLIYFIPFAKAYIIQIFILPFRFQKLFTVVYLLFTIFKYIFVVCYIYEYKYLFVTDHFSIYLLSIYVSGSPRN